MAARRGRTRGTVDGRAGGDGRGALRTLSDKPLEDDADDRLGFAAYADALAELLDHPDTDTPLTIAISAQWGAGKTSLAKMVEGRLKRRPVQRGDRPHITCWFNAWMHDDASHLGAAFAAEVAKTADRYRPMWRRLVAPLPSAMLSPEERWRRRLWIALVSFIVAVTIALLPGPGGVLRQAFTPKADVVDRLRELFGSTRVGIVIFLLVAFAFSRKLCAIAQAASRFVDDPRSEAAKGSMREVSAQLGQLVEQATHVRRQWLLFPRAPRRFVIFVDDLERCRPPRAVEVCEVASQLLGHPTVVTVLVADMATIAASAEIKYAELERARANGREGSVTGSVVGTYGRLYLQKIVQIQFNLPASPAKSMPGLLKEGARPIPAPRTPRERFRQFVTRWLFPSDAEERLYRMAWNAIISVVIVVLITWFIGRSSDDTCPPINTPQCIEQRELFTYNVQVVGFLAILFATVFVVRAVVRDYRTFRTSQAQRRIDSDIRQSVADGMASVEAVVEGLHRQGLEPEYFELAQQRAQRILADESATRTQAELEISEYLPALPRSAKRLFNHLRILLVIAEQKDMFGGEPELHARHLGKWAVLLERWPELGSALTADPGRLAQLEAATSVEELSKQLGSALPDSVANQDLLNFLMSPTKLASVAERLVYFQAAPPEEHTAVQPSQS